MANANTTMNKPFIYQAGHSFDSAQAGKCQIRVRNIRGQVEKLSGWFKDDKTAAKELNRRQREFGSQYGCR